MNTRNNQASQETRRARKPQFLLLVAGIGALSGALLCNRAETPQSGTDPARDGGVTAKSVTEFTNVAY